MADQAVLEERIEHIQRDVAEIKQDIRRVDGKADQTAKDLAALRLEVADVRTSVANLRTEMIAAIGALDAKLTVAIGELDTKFTAAIGALETKFTAAIGTAETRHAVMLVSLIKWMIGTMITGVGLASAIAFGVARIMQ